MDQYLDLQYRQDDLARHRENRGRMAQVSTTGVTSGVGTVELADAVKFGAIFIERPSFAYGSECDPDAIRDLLDLGPTDPIEFPQCSAHVTAWDIDENGHYRAAWLGLVVTYPLSIPLDVNVDITHHFGFTAVALKDVDPTG